MSAAADAATSRTRFFVLAATITASAMAFIDGPAVSIMLPVLQHDLNATLADLQWVSNAYLILLGALILIGGGLGDRVGRRRVFMTGIALFTLASLACAAAPTIRVLIVARAIQGIGAALLVPQSLAVISANFPREIRSGAIATWAAASSVATALAPTIGGLLVDLISWRAVFWLNVPLAGVALWLAWSYMPESRDDTAKGPIDWLGATVAVLSLGALSYGLIAISAEDPSIVAIVATIVAGLIGLVAFVVLEMRATNPIMPPGLFRSRVFAATNIVTVFLYGALSGMLFLLPFDLLARRGMPVSQAGLTVLPIGIIIGILTRLAGSLSDKYGPRPFLVVGPILVGLCATGFALGIESYWVGVFVPVLFFAVGLGIVISPLTTAVMNSIPDSKSGAASGINNAASRLAGVIAVAVFGAVASVVFDWSAPPEAHFGILPPASDPGRATVESAFLSGYSAAMLFIAAWCFAAAIVAWLTLAPRRTSTHDP
jgi:EmrB/QacA subfamily drug resistance transporter